MFRVRISLFLQPFVARFPSNYFSFCFESREKLLHVFQKKTCIFWSFDGRLKRKKNSKRRQFQWAILEFTGWVSFHSHSIAYGDVLLLHGTLQPMINYCIRQFCNASFDLRAWVKVLISPLLNSPRNKGNKKANFPAFSTVKRALSIPYVSRSLEK